jgi:hypothetical protein
LTLNLGANAMPKKWSKKDQKKCSIGIH